jgi:hypothetical protein
VIQKMPLDKSPGQDGFNGLFLKNVGISSRKTFTNSASTSSMVQLICMLLTVHS